MITSRAERNILIEIQLHLFSSAYRGLSAAKRAMNLKVWAALLLYSGDSLTNTVDPHEMPLNLS